MLGIYDFEGDSLKLCWRKGGGDRPATFAAKSEAGSGDDGPEAGEEVANDQR